MLDDGTGAFCPWFCPFFSVLHHLQLCFFCSVLRGYKLQTKKHVFTFLFLLASFVCCPPSACADLISRSSQKQHKEPCPGAER
jgi:hypothetical protein